MTTALDTARVRPTALPDETRIPAPTRRDRLASARPAVISLLAGIVLWEIVGQAAHLAFLPPLSKVLMATSHMMQTGEIFANLAASLAALAIGYTLAVVLGIPLGFSMARFRSVNDVAAPFVNALLAVPSLLFVPIFFALFGVSRLTQIAVIFIYSFVLIVLMAESGFRQVNADYIQMGRVFGADSSQLWRRVILPNALPTLMAGLRLGMGRAIRGMVNGEMLIVLVGLGALLRQYGTRFDAASVYGILLVIVSVALALDFLIRFADLKLNHWLE